MTLRDRWARFAARMRERAETPLPPYTPRPGDVARAVASLVLGLVMMGAGFLFLRGLLLPGPTRWWEFVLGFALAAGSLYVVRYGLLAGEQR